MMKNGKVRTGGRILYVPLDLLKSNPQRPRTVFDAEAEEALARSLAEHGVLEPLTVFYGEEDCYYIVSGERRFRAAKRLSLPALPCILIDPAPSDAAMLALAGNLHRSALHDFEKAEAIERISREYGLCPDEIAAGTGLPAQTLRELTRLLSVPEALRDRILRAGLPTEFAVLLLHHPDDGEKAALLDRILAERLTLPEAKALSAEMRKPRKQGSGRVVSLFKDLTVFLNTIEHAVDVMRESGIAAEREKTETAGEIEYRIRIPRI